ncbi:MAG: hypothetical protein ACK6D3_24250 [Planctomycetaceae bacterium]|jgi:hypothetical protein
MANEITVTLNVTLKNPASASTGYLADQFSVGGMRADQASSGLYSGVVATSTTEAAFPSLGLTTPGLMILQNLDSTNSIDWGPASGGAMVACGTLKPGGLPQMVYCKSTATFRHKASAGTPKLLIKIFEA